MEEEESRRLDLLSYGLASLVKLMWIIIDNASNHSNIKTHNTRLFQVNSNLLRCV